MTKRTRINPHDRGTAEHTLFNSWRRADLEAKRLQAEADWFATNAGAHRSKAAHYAAALSALGSPPDGAQKMITQRSEES
jgi:hypothetical protein